MNYPIVGIACLPPQPNALGGDIYVIGSPRHHLFHSALRDESEATVPVSILRLRPFYYVFNKTIAGADKVYYDNDPRLDQPIVKNAFTSQVDRKRFWDPATVWTELDFGAGPGSLAVREVKEQAVVLGVGGGKILTLSMLKNREERRDCSVYCRSEKTRSLNAMALFLLEGLTASTSLSSWIYGEVVSTM